MSRLYAQMRTDATKTTGTKRGHRFVTVQAETWNNVIVTNLSANDDGTVNYTVDLTDKQGNKVKTLAKGKIDG